MKAKDIKVGDKLYKFDYDSVYNEYERVEACEVKKVTAKRIYLEDTKLERKGNLPLTDNLGHDSWADMVMQVYYSKYSPDKDWNIKYNKQQKDKRKLDNELESVLDDIKYTYDNSSLVDKKRILEDLKDIN